MADPTPPTVSPRPPPEIGSGPAPKPAPWGFVKGLLTGAALEIPALAATVWLLARIGVGDPDAGFMQIMRLTTVFAGVAAVLTAAGIGRLAAHASAEGGRRRAMFVAARAHAVAGAGLVIIAAIPLGHLPAKPIGFIPLPLAGLVSGAICGALIGAVCGGTAPVGFSDVWSLAKKPSEALRMLLGPEDIVKLGTALRTRTTSVFHGIFEPAPKPPGETPAATPPVPPPPEPPPPGESVSPKVD